MGTGKGEEGEGTHQWHRSTNCFDDDVSRSISSQISTFLRSVDWHFNSNRRSGNTSETRPATTHQITLLFTAKALMKVIPSFAVPFSPKGAKTVKYLTCHESGSIVSKPTISRAEDSQRSILMQLRGSKKEIIPRRGRLTNMKFVNSLVSCALLKPGLRGTRE